MYESSLQIKRVTLNLPRTLLEDVQKITKKNITETIMEGLELEKKRHSYELAQKLQGKLKLSINLEASRERSRGYQRLD